MTFFAPLLLSEWVAHAKKRRKVSLCAVCRTEAQSSGQKQTLTFAGFHSNSEWDVKETKKAPTRDSWQDQVWVYFVAFTLPVYPVCAIYFFIYFSLEKKNSICDINNFCELMGSVLTVVVSFEIATINRKCLLRVGKSYSYLKMLPYSTRALGRIWSWSLSN